MSSSSITQLGNALLALAYQEAERLKPLLLTPCHVQSSAILLLPKGTLLQLPADLAQHVTQRFTKLCHSPLRLRRRSGDYCDPHFPKSTPQNELQNRCRQLRLSSLHPTAIWAPEPV